MTSSLPQMLERFSRFTLQLHSAAQNEDVQPFQRRALDLLGGLLHMDAAWWGHSSVIDGAHRVHRSFSWQLPEDVAQQLNLNDPQNLVARRTTALPGVVHAFGPDDWVQQTSTARLAAHMGIVQALCIAQVDAATGLASFISVARKRARPTFTTRDRRFLQLASAHLGAALELCLAQTLDRDGNGLSQSGGRLASDASGVLTAIQPGALALMRCEWSNWSGPLLPPALLAALQARRSVFLGRSLHAQFCWRHELLYVSLRPRQAQDRLTPREREVAQAYAAGRSYREVAEELGMSPVTVRHHLRSAYTKLDVQDKAMLARVLSGPD